MWENTLRDPVLHNEISEIVRIMAPQNIEKVRDLSTSFNIKKVKNEVVEWKRVESLQEEKGNQLISKSSTKFKWRIIFQWFTREKLISCERCEMRLLVFYWYWIWCIFLILKINRFFSVWNFLKLPTAAAYYIAKMIYVVTILL